MSARRGKSGNRLPFRTALRRAVFARDGHKCRKCPYASPDGDHCLEVHHIRPVCEGGTDDLDNLITLCAVCHSEWSWLRPVENFDEWLRLPSLLYVFRVVAAYPWLLPDLQREIAAAQAPA